MADVYIPGAVSQLLGKQSKDEKKDDASHLRSLFSPIQNKKTNQISRTQKKRQNQALLSPKKRDKPVVSKKRKTVEPIDELERLYEEKKAKLDRLAVTPETGKEQQAGKEKSRPRRDRKNRDPNRESRTIFVGNLSKDMTKKGVQNVFRKYGRIESLRFRSAAPADMKLPKKATVIKKVFHEDRHNINCYVVFETDAAAQEALQENGSEIDGLHIRVDLSAHSKQHKHGSSIFVGNLPFDAEEEPLRDHFEDCGEIENVRIVRDRATQLGKGFAFVSFQDKASVELALKLNEESWCGRKLRITRSLKNRKGPKMNGTKQKESPRKTTGRKDNEKPRRVAERTKSVADTATGTSGPGGDSSRQKKNKVKSENKLARRKEFKKKMKLKKKQKLNSQDTRNSNLAMKGKKLQGKGKKTEPKEKPGKKIKRKGKPRKKTKKVD